MSEVWDCCGSSTVLHRDGLMNGLTGLGMIGVGLGYLHKANVVGLLAKALAADVQAVFADQARAVFADATVRTTACQLFAFIHCRLCNRKKSESLEEVASQSAEGENSYQEREPLP